MSFSSIFQEQWTSFTDYLVSCLINESSSVNPRLYETACTVYRNEILRWSMEGQHNAAWLKELEKADSGTAAAFVQQLQSFQFKEETSAKASKIPTLVLASGGGIAGAGAALLLKWSVFPIIITTVVGAIAGGVGGKKMADNKMKVGTEGVIDAYSLQLQTQGERLLNIVKQADGKEPLGL